MCIVQLVLWNFDLFNLCVCSLELKEDDPIWSDNMTIRVNATGQVLHAYVNGKYLGT